MITMPTHRLTQGKSICCDEFYYATILTADL